MLRQTGKMNLTREHVTAKTYDDNKLITQKLLISAILVFNRFCNLKKQE